jgi:hypothetical protein
MRGRGSDAVEAMTCDELTRAIDRLLGQIQDQEGRHEAARRATDPVPRRTTSPAAPSPALLERGKHLVQAFQRKRCFGWTASANGGAWTWGGFGHYDGEAMTCEQLGQEIKRVANQIQEARAERRGRARDRDTLLSDVSDPIQRMLHERFLDLAEWRRRKECP